MLISVLMVKFLRLRVSSTKLVKMRKRMTMMEMEKKPPVVVLY